MSSTSPGTLGAVGIGVSDLAVSVDFYTRVMGMKQLQTFEVEYMDEVVVGFEGSRASAIVLMHYTDGSEQHYRDNPVKLVFYVPDPADLAERIAAEGLQITRAPAPMEGVGGTLVGLAKDPDGYVIEMIQTRSRQASSDA